MVSLNANNFYKLHSISFIIYIYIWYDDIYDGNSLVSLNANNLYKLDFIGFI